MSNPHPERPIAVPKRRLTRTASNTSIGSTGSAPGGSSPLAGFSFGSSTTPKAPLQPSNFNTGFSAGFGNNNPSPSFGNTPTSSITTPSNPSPFGGFNTQPSAPSTPFTGFGNNTTSNSMGAIGSTPTASPFGGFQTSGQTFQQTSNVASSDHTDMDAEESEKTTNTPSAFSGFGAPKDAAKPSGGFSFGTPLTTTTSNNEPKQPAFTGFFGTPTAKTTETEKPTTPTFSGFGNLNKPTETEKTTPVFTGFGSTNKPIEASKPSTPVFAGFGNIKTPAATEKTTPSFSGFNTAISKSSDNSGKDAAPISKPMFNFGAPKASTDTPAKPSDSPSPFAAFGKPTSSLFGTPIAKEGSEANKTTSSSLVPVTVSTDVDSSNSSTNTSSDKQSTESNKDEAEKDEESTDTPSPFSIPSHSEKPSPFGSFNKSTETEETPKIVEIPDSPTEEEPAEKPSPFTFGSSKPAAPSQLSALASPFKPSTTEKEPSDGKRSSISSVGSAKSTSTPFTFNKPTTESDKSATSFGSFGDSASTKPLFSFSTPAKSSESSGGLFGSKNDTSSSGFSFAKSTENTTTPSFSFGTPVSASTDKPAAASPSFSFGSSTSTGKPAAPSPSFSFGSPASTDKPSASPSFSFNQPKDTPATFKFNVPASSTTSSFGSASTSSSNKKRQLDRDDDEEEDRPSASKKTYPSGQPSSFSAATKPATFDFGSQSNNKENSTPKAPVFTFGAPADKPSPSGTAPVFTFGAAKETPAKETPSKESTTKPSESQNFSFGTPPPPAPVEEATPTSKPSTDKPAVSFSFTPTSKDDQGVAKPLGDKPALGKSPLSKSVTPSETTPKEPKEASTSFETPSKTSTTTPAAPADPGSATVAFGKSATSDSSTVLNVTAPTKSTASTGPSVQTTLKSNITEADQITYQTRFWELPDDARNELAQLAHFISEQTDKHDRIAQELSSSFGPMLHQVSEKTAALDTDTLILGQRLDAQVEVLDDITYKTKIQKINAMSATQVQHQDKKNWRTKGANENWAFFTDAVESMEKRLQQFSLATESIEQAIQGIQRDPFFTPSAIGAALDNQRKMYLALAGRVAELHQETDRIVKRRRLY